MEKKKQRFDRKAFMNWIGGDPYHEAALISEVPIAASTLIRIKNGSYIPSERMQTAINAVMERKNRSNDTRYTEKV